jgi:hypothetical protein
MNYESLYELLKIYIFKISEKAYPQFEIRTSTTKKPDEQCVSPAQLE